MSLDLSSLKSIFKGNKLTVSDKKCPKHTTQYMYHCTSTRCDEKMVINSQPVDLCQVKRICNNGFRCPICDKNFLDAQENAKRVEWCTTKQAALAERYQQANTGGGFRKRQ